MMITGGETFQTNNDMDISVDRPGSVLARGVQITEIGDGEMNPEPVPLDESDLLLHQFLSPRKLCLLGGVDDLEDITTLELKVDTSEMSLGNFGSWVQNLTELKLSNSTIHSIRDLGSCLHGLKILWMSQCSLQDLDGIGSLSCLRELYLAFNEISEISSVSMLENLQILDLEGNKIDCLSQVQYLAFCTKLTSLTLEGNPVCMKSSPDSEIKDYNYRLCVRDAIPHLETLDDEPLTNVDIKKDLNVFDEHWNYIEKLEQDSSIQKVLATKDTDEENEERFMSTSVLRPSSAKRPISAKVRPKTALTKKEIPRPFSAMAGIQTEVETSNPPDDISELTDGDVVCGNPSRALLSRSKQKTAPPASQRHLFPQLSFVPEHTYDPLPTQDLTEVLRQLQEWKTEHEKRQEEIKASWAPQVLKIEPGEYVDDSDEDIVPSFDNFSGRTTLGPLGRNNLHFDDRKINEEFSSCKEQGWLGYKPYKPVSSILQLKTKEQVNNPKRPNSARPSVHTHSLAPASRLKVFQSEPVKPEQSVLSMSSLPVKRPIIKEQISLKITKPDSKAIPRSFSAKAAVAIPHAPALLPSLPTLKIKSNSQKTT